VSHGVVCDEKTRAALIAQRERILKEAAVKESLDALKKQIEERLRHRKSCTIFERDLAIIWPRDERDQLKREKEIHAFAAANG
jgi:hypothetical protein